MGHRIPTLPALAPAWHWSGLGSTAEPSLLLGLLTQSSTSIPLCRKPQHVHQLQSAFAESMLYEDTLQAQQLLP